jgi:hypothetical protein
MTSNGQKDIQTILRYEKERRQDFAETNTVITKNISTKFHILFANQNVLKKKTVQKNQKLLFSSVRSAKKTNLTQRHHYRSLIQHNKSVQNKFNFLSSNISKNNFQAHSPISKKTGLVAKEQNYRVEQRILKFQTHQKNDFNVFKNEVLQKVDKNFVNLKQEIYQHSAIQVVNQVQDQVSIQSGEIAKVVLRELQRSSRIDSLRRGF